MKQRVETIIFNNIPYRRYPDSKHASLRAYYRRSAYKRFDGKTGFLHIDVWEHHNGPVPKGFHIHHKNGPNDNNIEALECLTRTEHMQRHKGRVATKEQLERLSRIRVLASKWHGSPEGIAWHERHGKQTWQDRQPIYKVCETCAAPYQTYFPSRSRFCGGTCKATALRRRRGVKPR